MSIDIEDLGSCVFEELAFDYLAYNPFLSEARVVDHYSVEEKHIELYYLLMKLVKHHIM